MSSDNCIAILITTDRFREDAECFYTEPNGITAYRVVHAQGIDNFAWIEQNQLYMLGKYMNDVWGKSPVFYDAQLARQYAGELYDSVNFTEYGIVFIEAEKYSFN